MLQPSFGGFFGLIGLTLAVMIGSGLLYVSKTGLFYEYLFGSTSSSQLIETSRSTIALFNETVFGNPTLNKILFFVFWMVVGLVVYVLISGVGGGIQTAEEAVEESHFVNAKRWQIKTELGLKAALVCIAFGLSVIYSVLLVNFLLPFGILSARIVAGDVRNLTNWGYGFLGFIVLLGTFYFGLVLLRFLLLRPRIFGGWEDIISDEIAH